LAHPVRGVPAINRGNDFHRADAVSKWRAGKSIYLRRSKILLHFLIRAELREVF